MRNYSEAHKACARHAVRLVGEDPRKKICVKLSDGRSVHLPAWKIVALMWLDGVEFTPKAVA